MDESGAYDDDGHRVDVWPNFDLEYDRRTRELLELPLVANVALGLAVAYFAGWVAGLASAGVVCTLAVSVWAGLRPSTRLVVALDQHQLRIRWRGLPWLCPLSVPLAELTAAEITDHTLTVVTRNGRRRLWFPPCLPEVEEAVRALLTEAKVRAAEHGTPADIPRALSRAHQNARVACGNARRR